MGSSKFVAFLVIAIMAAFAYLAIKWTNGELNSLRAGAANNSALEAENGVVNGASVMSDTSASNGKYIQFPPSPTPVINNIYYVDGASGSDSNTGSSTAPFKTIQKGVNMAHAGDEVLVRKGVYQPSGDILVTHNPSSSQGFNGTATSPVIIKAEYDATDSTPDKHTVLLGPGTEPGPKGFYLSGSQYVIIEGFEIRNMYLGILAVNNATHNLFQKNMLNLNTMVGVDLVGSVSNTVSYNQFLDPGPTNTGVGYQDYGVALENGANSNSITHNFFFGRSHQSISVKYVNHDNYIAYNNFDGCMLTCIYLGQEDDQPGIDNTSSNTTVEYNSFKDASDATNGYYRLRNPIAIRNTANASVRYNYFENMMYSAIRVLSCSSSTSPECGATVGTKPLNALILGNTIVNSTRAELWPAIDVIGRGYLSDTVEVYNNTIYNTPRVLSVNNGPTTSAFTAIAETSNPPTVKVTNNNFVNVGYNGAADFLNNGDSYDGGLNTMTTTFSNNNWYEFSSPTTNYAKPLDSHLDPKFNGPLSVISPINGPLPVYDINVQSGSWQRAHGYTYQSTSGLINKGTALSGLTSSDGILDIGSNEFLP